VHGGHSVEDEIDVAVFLFGAFRRRLGIAASRMSRLCSAAKMNRVSVSSSAAERIWGKARRAEAERSGAPGVPEG
jgi:hypothetical protein